MGVYSIGVSISENEIWFGILKSSGEELMSWSIPTMKKRGCKAILSDISKEVKRKLESIRIADREVAGIGVSVPAEVDRSGGLKYCEDLGWGIVNIAELLSRLSGFRVKAGGSSEMAVLGEHWFMGKSAPENMAGLQLENELRGSVIIHNRLVYGQNGRSGNVGQIYVKNDSSNPNDREKLQYFSSMKSIVETYIRQADCCDKTGSGLSLDKISAKEIIRSAVKGDPLCNKILDDWASVIAFALYNMACITRIEKVIIGGPLEKENNIMAEKINRFYRKLADREEFRIDICASELGKKAEVYGCAGYLLQTQD